MAATVTDDRDSGKGWVGLYWQGMGGVSQGFRAVLALNRPHHTLKAPVCAAYPLT